MIITCGSCGKKMRVKDDVPNGQVVRCPGCGERTTIELLPERPKLKIVRRESHSASSGQYVDYRKIKMAEERLKTEESARRKERQRETARNLVVLAALTAVLLTGWFLFAHRSEGGKLAEREKEMDTAQKIRENVAERERESEEWERMQRERRMAREREESERAAAEAEAERARRMKIAELEAERQRQIVALETAKRAYRMAKEKFAAPFSFVKSAPEDEMPQSVNEPKTFWCVFASHDVDKDIYEIKVLHGGDISVSVLSPAGMAANIDAEMFMARLKNEQYAITSGAKVYVGGVRIPSGTYDVPPAGVNFSIMEACFGAFYQTAVVLGFQVPNVTYNVFLKPEKAKRHKDNIPLGTVGYDGVIGRDAMVSAIGQMLSKKAVGALLAQNGNSVKKKKFKRTVVLYDGLHIKTGIGGVTMVPRTFKHLGTSTYDTKQHDTVSAFKRKWQSLHDEALRQERREREVEAENAAELARAKAEQQRKLEVASKTGTDAKVVEEALSKCKLVVEFAGRKEK